MPNSTLFSGRPIVVALFAAALMVGGDAMAAIKLVKVEGQVWVKPPGHNEALASIGANLAPGSNIRTGKHGSAEVIFENGSILKVRPSTSMQLSGNRRQKKKNSVILFFGRIWNKVTRTEDREYEVKTANAVCGVRGTEFETAVGDDGSVRVRVTEGEVGVGNGIDTEGATGVRAGSAVDADEGGVGQTQALSQKPEWKDWQAARRERLRTNGKTIVGGLKAKIMDRKARLEKLVAKQKRLERERKRAESRGDVKTIRRLNDELSAIADEIADLGDETASHFGMVDHIKDLAEDPRFRMVGRKYLILEAENLRRVKADLDRMVAEGTDISIEGMEKVMDDMGKGGGTLKDGPGSTVDDLFGNDDMMR